MALSLRFGLLFSLASVPSLARAEIIHNRNPFDVQVAVGQFGEGIKGLTGIGTGQDTVRSQGWYRIPANGYQDLQFTHLYVVAVKPNGTRVPIAPARSTPDKDRPFFFKESDFLGIQLPADGNLEANIRQRGGELKTFHHRDGFFNIATRLVEIPPVSAAGKGGALNLVGIHNGTTSNRTFRFRWNPKMPWESWVTLAPRERRLFQTTEPGPTPQVEFDQGTPTGFQGKIQALESFRLDVPKADELPGDYLFSRSRQYSFRPSGSLVVLGTFLGDPTEAPATKPVPVNPVAGPLFINTLEPRKSLTYHITYRAFQLARVELEGQGNTELELEVLDDKGRQVAAIPASKERGQVRWAPQNDGICRIIIRNQGFAPNRVRLSHNGTAAVGNPAPE